MHIKREEILEDYRHAYKSRQVSIIGRREVLSGKAKFGIFGAGKELPQLALAKVFKPGDFRSGYYRDQTLFFRLGILSYEQFFAQLYADSDLRNEPSSGGRQMNAHFSTRLLDEKGEWVNATELFNSSADVSPTAAQMPRLVGLAQASKLYRDLNDLLDGGIFSRNGNEIAFGTIGNASSAEGIFWESINAISVLQVPAVISIWDDDFGISVPNEDQFGKSLTDLLSGFQKKDDDQFGFEVRTVKGWDYLELIHVYADVSENTRRTHTPAIIHVTELTQPQGHSTSGSHERYKTATRLEWEARYDCLSIFRNWIIDKSFVTEQQLLEFELEDQNLVEEARKSAWVAYKSPIINQIGELGDILDQYGYSQYPELMVVFEALRTSQNSLKRDIFPVIDYILQRSVSKLPESSNIALKSFRQKIIKQEEKSYSSHLYSQSSQRAEKIDPIEPIYSVESPTLNGFEILNKNFESVFNKYPYVVAFGEDLGRIGGVNQGFAGLQHKFGALRIADAGIREATIIGQAIGLAMRGLRPIAEIQYLDYLLYALQIMSDDLATVQWRTVGGQKAPVIVRTRGHRLEGIWHSGSPIGALINLLRGIHILVPRNMVQAAGFYNTLLASDEPGVVIELLNGYRKKERLPDNIGDIRIPLGVPEVIVEGEDITVVTYGALCEIATRAADRLSEMDIAVEVIDVRSVLPFDTKHKILDSIRKTNRVLFLDEDVPGGASAYMMQQVLVVQGGYYWLDSAPKTLTAKAHRPAYGSDGGYFSKPNLESIVELIYQMMRETNPGKFPDLYGENL